MRVHVLTIPWKCCSVSQRAKDMKDNNEPSYRRLADVKCKLPSPSLQFEIGGRAGPLTSPLGCPPAVLGTKESLRPRKTEPREIMRGVAGTGRLTSVPCSAMAQSSLVCRVSLQSFAALRLSSVSRGLTANYGSFSFLASVPRSPHRRGRQRVCIRAEISYTMVRLLVFEVVEALFQW